MGPIWGRQDPGGPHVGPMNIAIRDIFPFSEWYNPWMRIIFFFSFPETRTHGHKQLWHQPLPCEAKCSWVPRVAPPWWAKWTLLVELDSINVLTHWILALVCDIVRCMLVNLGLGNSLSPAITQRNDVWIMFLNPIETLRLMPQNTFDDKSTLVQVMPWCHRGPSHSQANVDPDLCLHMA